MSTWRRALRHPGTWLGLAAIGLIVAGAYAMPATPEEFTRFGPLHQWWWRMRGKGRHLQFLGAVVALIAFAWLRPTRKRPAVNAWPVFILWSLPLLVSLPLFSPDLFSYMDYSWILHEHLDPYRVGLGTIPGPYSKVADAYWTGAIAVYPALDLRVYQLISTIAGYQVIPSVLLARLPALLGAVVTGLCIPDIARRFGVDRDKALWMALLNPVTLLIGVGGGHNDMLMLGLMLAGLWAALRRHGWIVCAVLAALACGIKQPGLVVALTGAMIATRDAGWAKRLGYAVASLAIAAATFVVTSLATGLGFGWLRGLAIPGSVASMAPQWALGTLILIAIGLNVTGPLRILCYVAMAAAMAYAVVRLWRHPLAATAWVLALYAGLSPNMHAWYWIPVLTLIGLLRAPRSLRAAVAGGLVFLMVGTVMSITYRIDTLFVVFLCGDLALVVAWWWLNRARLAEAMALPASDVAAPAGIVQRSSDSHVEHDPVTGEQAAVRA